mgnify:CR=1 FL=1
MKISADEDPATPQSETWTALWKEARDVRSKCVDNEKPTPNDLLDVLRRQFPAWKDQLLMYTKEFSASNNQQLTDRTKDLILETRAALRFGLCCFSFESEAVRCQLQDCAVLDYEWHQVLVVLLAQRSCDSKCRVFAARLLSNLVTSNAETAAALSSSFPIPPSNACLSSTLIQAPTNEK